MNLEELRRKRLKWVEANRENDFEEGIGRLLTELYPDNAHFIYELLQNAEDARATEVRFILKEDGAEFEHNGSQLFTLEDVESITSIGVSTKKDDPTNIGKFGVGFKAVFAYTETPEITSGQYHFRIRDLVVPDTDGLSPCDLGERGTRFLFPFDNSEKYPEKAREEIEENLRQLDESTLLFLNNIRKIEYLLPDSSLGFLERKETDGNRIEILVQHPEDSESTSIFFLRFEKTVDVNDEKGEPKSCRIAVAFGLEEREEDAKKSDKKRKQPSSTQWRIQSLERGRVSIYFPAEKETSNLRFHLHAPFASTVARDSVRRCKANDELRDHLADLIAESMTAIRDQGLLTVGFLATLPNNRDHLSLFYKPILDRLITAFQSEDLTPMKQGGHAAAKGIFRGLGLGPLSALISDNDLATIIGEGYSPPLWAANPPLRNQREDNFLTMLDIPAWTTQTLVNKLSASETIMRWLAKKPEEWHQRLYSLLGDFLLGAPSSYAAKDELSKLRIIRCSDDKYRVGNECYFPSDDPSDDVEQDEVFPRVVEAVYSSGRNSENEKARKFLENIGVREVDETERVKAILKQRYSKDSIKPRKQDMDGFVSLVEKEPEQAGLFRRYYIFELENEKWGQPGAVFLDSPYLDTGLKAYYDALGENSSRQWALSPKYEESGIEPKRLGEFAEKVGAQTKLKPKEQKILRNHPEKDKLEDDGGWSPSYGTNEDYDIPEFDVLLARPGLSKSKLVWETMNAVPDDVLKARYRSNSWYPTKLANSTLVHKLRKNEWVPQKQDDEKKCRFVKPSDAVAESLPSGFRFDSGAKWLESIEFGKAKRDHDALERDRQEQATWNYQRRNTAAKEIGFSSIEEAQEAQEMAKLKRQDPEGYKRWKDSNEKKASFPTRTAKNPERRKGRLAGQYADASEKEYETQERSVRTSRGDIDPTISLRNWYTNDADQMICQICKEEMPFRKRDGEYYFEAVEALSQKYFNKEHEAQFLALCPLCAARYKEFVKRDEDRMRELHAALKELTDSDEPEIVLTLGEWETSLRFVETHRSDIMTILSKSPSP